METSQTFRKLDQTKPEVEFIHSQKEYDINLRKKKFTVYINKHKEQNDKITVYFEGHIIIDKRIINDLLKRIEAFSKASPKPEQI